MKKTYQGSCHCGAVRNFDMLHGNFKSPPAETRHL
jgi:hypothetical protein